MQKKSTKKISTSSVKAGSGQKMIKITVSLWTDGIAPTKGHIDPKHAWAAGTVNTPKNKSHGIDPLKKPIKFNSIEELPKKIEKLLKEQKIILHYGK